MAQKSQNTVFAIRTSDILVCVVVTAEPSVIRQDYKQIERILLDFKTEA